ncbi:hypothetical protein ABZ858_20945 [Streptomyces sp. NPDC047017]|uniref:hypothetical protein n=1 Tax=Streptomyces sp. NPDC047017 TaxID=3155024 RepID=UPI0034012DFD
MDISVTTDTDSAAGTATDSAAAARHARFGKLPERVSYADMVEERPAGPRNPTGDGYDPEDSWTNFSCLAADLGL